MDNKLYLAFPRVSNHQLLIQFLPIRFLPRMCPKKDLIPRPRSALEEVLLKITSSKLIIIIYLTTEQISIAKTKSQRSLI